MILVYGTVCLDRVHTVPSLPPPGGYVEIVAAERHLGGEALNTATALTRWQSSIRLAGNSLGRSLESDWLRKHIAESDLPTPELPEFDHPAPVCDIYVTPDGERTMFGYGFATMQKTSTPAKVDLTGVTLLTVDGNLGQAAAIIADRAQDNSIPVYAMDTDEVVKLAPNGFWQTSTDRVGRRGDIQRNLLLVQKTVKAQNCFCIHSDGANGFIAGGPNHPVRHYPPFPAPAVVDSTGAGDAFRAGMLYGLSQNWPITQCLQFASAAGCLNCRAFGAINGLPTVKEALDLVAAHPYIANSYE